MAHALQPIPANPAFKKIKESNYASDYIYNKKSIITYCNEKKNFACKKSWNQGNYLLYNNGRTRADQCLYAGNTSELYSNLFTKENLTGVCTVEDIQYKTCSPKLSNADPFYDTYNIDPNGELFGRSQCGINNYVMYMQPGLQNSDMG